MNAREHADAAVQLTEQAQRCHDDDLDFDASEPAALAQAHALTSIALSLVAATDRAAIAEFTGGSG